MAKTEILHIRIDPNIKTEVEKALNPLGISITEAITIFLHQVILNDGLSFTINFSIPNVETLAAMHEAQDIAFGKKKSQAAHSVAEFMKDLATDVDD